MIKFVAKNESNMQNESQNTSSKSSTEAWLSPQINFKHSKDLICKSSSWHSVYLLLINLATEKSGFHKSTAVYSALQHYKSNCTKGSS